MLTLVEVKTNVRHLVVSLPICVDAAIVPSLESNQARLNVGFGLIDPKD